MLRAGTCVYCGQTIMVEAKENTEKEVLNLMATEECTCAGAMLQRQKKVQRSKCIENINRLIEPTYPEVAELLKASIDLIQTEQVKKLTLNLKNSNIKITMKQCVKGIKLELEQKQTQEELAEEEITA